MVSLKKNCSFLLLGIFIFTLGCVDKKSSIYNPEEVGTIMETTQGTIVTSRKIVIAGLKKDSQYWGAAIGATIAGATTYGLTGGDNVLEEAAIIISVISGALAGTAIDEMRNKSDGIEYTINIMRTTNVGGVFVGSLGPSVVRRVKIVLQDSIKMKLLK